MIWQLIFHKTPDAPRVDCFEVGYFRSLDEVEAVKAAYAGLPGFRDALQGTWELVGHAADAPADGVLWRATGFNWSEEGDERDLICSPLFADSADAEAFLTDVQARCPRDHFALDPIRIDRRCWAEGFGAG